MNKKNEPHWWARLDHEFDLESLPEYKQTAQDLKEADWIQLPEDDEFFENLHNKIMNQVAQTSVEHKKRDRWWRKRSVQQKTASILLGLVIFAFGSSIKNYQNDGLNGALTDALSRTDIDKSILVYQHKNEFFLDLASKNLDHMNMNQLKKLMEN